MGRRSNFIHFDANLWLESDELDRVIDFLKEPLMGLSGIQRWHVRFTDHLRLVLLNLLHAYNQDPSTFVAYSRDKNFYTDLNKRPQRYQCVELRYESMIMIVDCFCDPLFGYVVSRRGFYDRDVTRDDNKSEVAKMHATSSLIHLLTQVFPLPIHLITRHPNEDLIVMREKKDVLIKHGPRKGKTEKRKFDVDYVDTSETVRMRENLKRINTLIDEHFIGLAVQDEVLQEIKQKLVAKAEREKGRVRNLDFSKTRNRRKFNNRSWDQGGRFYNGWWQEVPSDYRKFIRIDNFSTVEIDFSGLHFMLLYLEKGLGLPSGDVYELETINQKIEKYAKKTQANAAAVKVYKEAARKFLKKAANIALNAEDQKSAIAAIKRECREERKKIPFLKTMTTEGIIQLLIDKHSALGNIFYTGHGVFLQNIDSHLAERVLLILAEKGIPALPVHDSFIVSRKHKEDLFSAMQEATSERYGVSLKIKDSGTSWAEIYEIGIEEEVGSVEGLESPRWTNRKECSEYYRQMKGFEQRTGKNVITTWRQSCNCDLL